MVDTGLYDEDIDPEFDALFAGYAAGFNRYTRERGDAVTDPACAGPRTTVRTWSSREASRASRRSHRAVGRTAPSPTARSKSECRSQVPAARLPNSTRPAPESTAVASAQTDASQDPASGSLPNRVCDPGSLRFHRTGRLPLPTWSQDKVATLRPTARKPRSS